MPALQDLSLEARFPLSSLSADGQERKALEALCKIGLNAGADGNAAYPVLQAMRKLREGLLASGRQDADASRMCIFIVRAGILSSHEASYRPAVSQLLDGRALSAGSDAEIRAYFILDLIAQGHLRAARESIQRWLVPTDSPLVRILNATARDHWSTFWRDVCRLNCYERRLLQPAYHRMRRHTLCCLQAAYMTVDLKFVERALCSSWEELKAAKLLDPSWTLEGDSVRFRPPKVSPSRLRTGT